MIDSEKRFYNPLEKYKIDYKKKLEKNRHCKFVFDIVQRIVDLQRELTFHSIPSMCIIQARKNAYTFVLSIEVNDILILLIDN